MTSDNLVTQEVRRMGAETAPLLATSVVFMIVGRINKFGLKYCKINYSNRFLLFALHFGQKRRKIVSLNV